MKRVVCWLGVVLGMLGVVLCAAALVGAWVYYPRVKQKTEEAYAKIDEALDHVGERIDLTKERIVTVNVMTEDFRMRLKEWVVAQHFKTDICAALQNRQGQLGW